jgi:hypothetical protein
MGKEAAFFFITCMKKIFILTNKCETKFNTKTRLWAMVPLGAKPEKSIIKKMADGRTF